jgi:hypothetical protein
MSVQLEAKPSGLTADLKKVSWKAATTFTGLCSEHDNSLFAPIEKGALDLDNPEHAFLLAYRSVLHETHSQMEAAIKTQNAYTYRIEQGLDREEDLTPAMLVATSRIAFAFETHKYKLRLDDAYIASDWSALAHNIVRIPTSCATVAGATVYSFDDILGTNGGPLVHLNVFPESASTTVVVFSYLSGDGRQVRRQLRPYLSKQVGRVSHELSRLLLDSCGNLVFAPSFVESWSRDKREVILEYFIRTSEQSDLGFDSPHFELFSPCTQ